MLLLLGKHRHFGHCNAGLIVDVCRGGWALGTIKVFQDAAMMMIAFITIKSSLVPLIEGLCAQI